MSEEGEPLSFSAHATELRSSSVCGHEPLLVSPHASDAFSALCADQDEESTSVSSRVISVGQCTFCVATDSHTPTGLVRGELRPSYGGLPVAIYGKAIPHADMDDFLQHEGRVMRILRHAPHPGFAPLRTIIEPQKGDDDLETSYLVFDALDVDLGTHIAEQGPLCQAEARDLFRQLVAAVSHAHRHNIVLRHIRPSKIYFTDELRTRLVFADLDGADVVPGNSSDGLPRLHDVDEEAQLHGVDVYALGVVLYVMLTGVYPQSRDDVLESDGLAVSAPLWFPLHMSTSVTLRSFMNRLFDSDASPTTVHDLADEVWMQCDLEEQALADAAVASEEDDNAMHAQASDTESESEDGDLDPTDLEEDDDADEEAVVEVGGHESSSRRHVPPSFRDQRKSYRRGGYVDAASVVEYWPASMAPSSVSMMSTMLSHSAAGRTCERRRSVVMVTDTDQVVPAVSVAQVSDTSSNKRKASEVPELLQRCSRQRLCTNPLAPPPGGQTAGKYTSSARR
eukprot:m.159633 g.159633  ORF g.159633 m.159633 type:complete len:509 (-) comp11819_c0_seq1:290-1816(-)